MEHKYAANFCGVAGAGAGSGAAAAGGAGAGAGAGQKVVHVGQEQPYNDDSTASHLLSKAKHCVA
eukprot:7767740-Ditylum_brightwellii.AAC.1